MFFISGITPQNHPKVHFTGLKHHENKTKQPGLDQKILGKDYLTQDNALDLGPGDPDHLQSGGE